MCEYADISFVYLGYFGPLEAAMNKATTLRYSKTIQKSLEKHAPRVQYKYHLAFKLENTPLGIALVCSFASFICICNNLDNGCNYLLKKFIDIYI